MGKSSEGGWKGKTPLSKGTFLVRAVRAYLQGKFIDPKGGLGIEWPLWAREKRGVFVTLLEDSPGRGLRGCVGFPEAVFPLKDAVLEAAFSAAFRDSRFPPLEREELGRIVVEVSLLTVPERICAKDGKDLFGKIRIGKDGLIIRHNSFSGLLLPQVPVEFGWGVPEFLSQTCRKAGLPGDFWIRKIDSLDIYRFQSEIFSEVSPGGKVAKISLKKQKTT